MPEGQSQKKWSIEEETQMMNEINNNKTITQIANIHQRSNNAIVMRLCEIGKRLIEQKGKTIQEVQKYLKLVSINEIESYIKRENDKKNKNSEVSKQEKKKEETIDSVKSELKELQTKYNKIKNIDDRFNELNKKVDELKEINIKMDKVLDLFTNTQDKKVKIKKSQKE
jgi:hypothetical protein